MGILSSIFGERPSAPQTGGFTVGAEIPKELAPFYKDILGKSQALYDDSVSQGYQPYTGPSLAEFTPEQQQAFTGIAGLQGQQAPVYQEAMGMTRDSAAPITTEQIEEYMNPYQQAVVDVEKREATKQYQSQVQPQLAAQAARIQPFGGSRQAILEGMAADTQQRLLGDIQAKGSAQAYQDSVNLLNQQRMQQGQAAGQLATMGSNQFKSQLGELGALQTIGEEKQQLSQQALNEAYGQYLKEQEYPYQQLGRYQSVVTGAPIQGTTYVPPTPPGPSVGTQLLSGLGTLGATYGAFGGFSPGGFMGANKTASTGGGIGDLPVIRRKKKGSVWSTDPEFYYVESEAKRNNKEGYPKGGNWGGDSAFPHPDIGGYENIPGKPYGFSMRDLLAKYNIDPKLYEYYPEYVPERNNKRIKTNITPQDIVDAQNIWEMPEGNNEGIKTTITAQDIVDAQNIYEIPESEQAVITESEQAVIDAAGPTKHPLEVFSKYKGTGFDTSPAEVKTVPGEVIRRIKSADGYQARSLGNKMIDVRGPDVLRKVKREHTAGEGQHYGMDTGPLANLTVEEKNNLLVKRKREEAAAIVTEQKRKAQELLDSKNEAKILKDAKKDKDEPGEDKPDVYADATAAEEAYLLALGNRETRIQGDIDKLGVQEREAQFGNLAMMFARLGTKSGPLLSALVESTGEILPAALKTKNEFAKEGRRLATAIEDTQLGELKTVAEFKKARAKLKSTTAQKVLENSWKKREVEVKEQKNRIDKWKAENPGIKMPGTITKNMKENTELRLNNFLSTIPEEQTNKLYSLIRANSKANSNTEILNYVKNIKESQDVQFALAWKIEVGKKRAVQLNQEFTSEMENKIIAETLTDLIKNNKEFNEKADASVFYRWSPAISSLF